MSTPNWDVYFHGVTKEFVDAMVMATYADDVRDWEKEKKQEILNDAALTYKKLGIVVDKNLGQVYVPDIEFDSFKYYKIRLRNLLPVFFHVRTFNEAEINDVLYLDRPDCVKTLTVRTYYEFNFQWLDDPSEAYFQNNLHGNWIAAKLELHDPDRLKDFIENYNQPITTTSDYSWETSLPLNAKNLEGKVLESLYAGYEECLIDEINKFIKESGIEPYVDACFHKQKYIEGWKKNANKK